MTDFPEDLFTQVYRRAATDEDRARLLGVKSALGLSSRDEFWPITMVLDHYDRSIQSGRVATVKEIKGLLVELKEIPEKAGPIASAQAEKAVARIIQDASDKIANATAKKTITTADRISKKQYITAAIVGGIVAAVVAGIGAAAMYLILDARGLCGEPPGATRDGSIACIVERSSG